MNAPAAAANNAASVQTEAHQIQDARYREENHKDDADGRAGSAEYLTRY